MLGELVNARVRSGEVGNPSLWGGYVTASWVLTGGGPRPYDRTVGYARRLPVVRRFGELELVARWGRVDLDDASVRGGRMDEWMVGVNWWATKRWKASVGWRDTRLDRFDAEGHTRILLTRLQWIH